MSPDLHSQLVNKITSLEAQLAHQSKTLEQSRIAYESLLHQFKCFQRDRFGSRSEKYIDSENPQQSLFTEQNKRTDLSSVLENVNDSKTTIDIPAHQRKKSKSKKEPERRVVIIPVDESDKQCACGSFKNIIRYESCEYYSFQPALFELIEEKREVVACPKGCEKSIQTAIKPKAILPKTKASPSLLAHIIVSKFVDRQPLYHLEKQFKQRYGVVISRRTMAQWLIDLTPKIQPLLNLMKDHIIDYDVAAMDATTLQVLNEPGRPPTKKSYVYCFRGGPPNKKVILYEYNALNHKTFLKEWFSGFSGSIHSDADPFFNDLKIQTDIDLSYCNAHARRKFEPIAKAAKAKGIAHQAMQYYQALYRIEREVKVKQLTPNERYKLRLKKAAPIINEFKVWLNEIQPTLLPKSPLGKAVNYVQKHWDGLTHYLIDERLEIDNNLTEQQIKPFVIIRKNFLFAASIPGAKALCAHMSLVRTAIAHGLEPFHYIQTILERLPHCRVLEEYEKILPWNFTG